jgi:hypothetical protein
MAYIYSAPESATDVRSGYHLGILRKEQKITREEHGGFTPEWAIFHFDEWSNKLFA